MRTSWIIHIILNIVLTSVIIRERREYGHVKTGSDGNDATTVKEHLESSQVWRDKEGFSLRVSGESSENLVSFFWPPELLKN